MEREDVEAVFRAGQTILRVVNRTGSDRALEGADQLIGATYDLLGLPSTYCDGCDADTPLVILDAEYRCPDCHVEGVDTTPPTKRRERDEPGADTEVGE